MTERMAVFGEPLSEPIYWKGRQLAVTSYGIEALDGTYVIESNRIREDDGMPWTKKHGGRGWIAHMSEKDWVDLADFENALLAADDVFRAPTEHLRQMAGIMHMPFDDGVRIMRAATETKREQGPESP